MRLLALRVLCVSDLELVGLVLGKVEDFIRFIAGVEHFDTVGGEHPDILVVHAAGAERALLGTHHGVLESRVELPLLDELMLGCLTVALHQLFRPESHEIGPRMIGMRELGGVELEDLDTCLVIVLLRLILALERRLLLVDCEA